ncbi:MAG: hypothetical protein U0892_22555 [Pirellulales bacterium]
MTSKLRVPTNSESKRPKFLAVEFEVRGHHADYVRNFAHLWLQRDIPADIEFLVSRRFSEHHGNVIRAINESGDDRVSLRLIDEADQQLLERKPRLKYWYGWQIFCRYAETSAADHALLMYSDYFQLPSVIGRRSPCPFSAVYFRPTFHYRTFANYHPNLKQRFTALRKAWLLQRFLKVKELRGLYCLDPLAVPYIQEQFKTDARVAHLADSFTLQVAGPSRAAEFRASLGIEPDRKIFCLLGVLDGRKGPVELLESVRLIAPEIGRHIAIVLLGYIPDHGPQNLEALAAEMNGVNNVQVVLRNAYIDSADVQHYYEMSDVILTTYQRHMGSSSALIRAALARRPVPIERFRIDGRTR